MNIEDFLYPFLKVYYKSPHFIQVILGKLYRTIPLSLRYGKTYNFYHNLLAESGYWDETKKTKFTISRLKKTLINAYENTDYFKKLFDEKQFDPYIFNKVEEIEKIPFTDRNILKQYSENILSKNVNKTKLLYMSTGGTSGVPIEVYYQKGVERSREFTFITDLWKRTGYVFSDKIAVLRGTVVDYKKRNILFREEPIKNRLFLSTFDLNDNNIELYIAKLKEYKPNYIHTYPSAISLMAKFLIENSIELNPLKGIFCSSEQFYPGQRELIEKAFNTKVFSWYGHTEGTTLAGECEHSQNYHIYFEYGYTELIDENGKIITEAGKVGEIVGTSFEMNAFPIIRYRTGDFAEYVEEKCRCGRNYKLITNVKGRWLQENLITYKNSNISLTALNMHSDLFKNVKQYQFYQEKKGEVVLKIIKGANFDDTDEIKILKDFNEKLKDLINLKIIYVDNIQRTGVGKHKFLIQEIKV